MERVRNRKGRGKPKNRYCDLLARLPSARCPLYLYCCLEYPLGLGSNGSSWIHEKIAKKEPGDAEEEILLLLLLNSALSQAIKKF